MAKHSIDPQIRQWAREGARQQLARIAAAFPDLMPSAPSASTPQPGNAQPGRQRKPMDAAARAAISRRMKAYWAGRRRKAVK